MITPANVSIVGPIRQEPPLIEHGRVFFTLRFTIDASTDTAEEMPQPSYFSIGASSDMVQQKGALQIRLDLLEMVGRQLTGVFGPVSVRRIVEEFDHMIGSFDWSKLDGTELWHMEPQGYC